MRTMIIVMMLMEIDNANKNNSDDSGRMKMRITNT